MKQNPLKLSELLEKQNEDGPPAENQMNLPYHLKKRKEPESISSKEVSKQQKMGPNNEDDKNKKTTKSLRFRPFKNFFEIRHQIKSKLRADQIPSDPESLQRSKQNHFQSSHGEPKPAAKFKHAFFPDHQ